MPDEKNAALEREKQEQLAREQADLAVREVKDRVNKTALARALQQHREDTFLHAHSDKITESVKTNAETFIEELTEGQKSPNQLPAEEREKLLQLLNKRENITAFTPLIKVVFLAGQHFTPPATKIQLLETAKWILDQDSSKVDINIQSSIGQTALHHAVVLGATTPPPLNERFNDIAKTLIAKDANLEIMNERKDSPRKLIEQMNSSLKEFLDKSPQKTATKT